MSIVLGNCGYCRGVQHALDIALCAANECGKAYCLHPVVHNKKVTDDLTEHGVIIENIDKIPDNSAVIINAHGCTLETERTLKSKNFRVFDATCAVITDVQKAVKNYSDKGFEILIIGDKNHIEIQGIASRAASFQIAAAENEFDLSRSEKFFIVVQTTFSHEAYKKIENSLRQSAENSSKTLVFKNSICYTTLEKQSEAEKLSQNADIVIVVGDYASSNSRKLCEIAKKSCENVYQVENSSGLLPLNIKKQARIAILSGASTPKSVTTEVFKIMSEIINDSNNETVNTTESTKVKTVAPVAMATGKPAEKQMSMEEAMKKYGGNSQNVIREGKRMRVRVSSADQTGIFVVLEGGGKNDSGFIPSDEAELDGVTYDPANYKANDEIEAMVIPKPEKASKAIYLSKKQFDALKADDEQVKGILEGQEFTLALTETKGGLIGKIGTYTIFVPASHVHTSFVKDLKDFVGKPLRLVALPPKEEPEVAGEEGEEKRRQRNPKRIVASARVIKERERSARDDEFWNTIYEGAIVSGKVKRFATFGAFVSLKHIDGLVHNSDLSWSKKRINNPGEVLEINKTYNFIILAADRSAGKISLGYKQLNKKPSEIAMEKYPVGSVVKGKVVRLVKFGAFVELEPGIDGLVHISQINRNFVQNANDALKEGDEVDVKVMQYDDERITLSIKELLPEEVVVETVETDAVENVKGKGKGKGNQRKTETVSAEPKEYVSSNSGVTFGDLFKNFKTDN